MRVKLVFPMDESHPTGCTVDLAFESEHDLDFIAGRARADEVWTLRERPAAPAPAVPAGREESAPAEAMPPETGASVASETPPPA